MTEPVVPAAARDLHACEMPCPRALPRVQGYDLLLLGAILAALLYGIGDYGLYEPHEAHFAGVGREMVLRHDWVTPHLNGAPYLNKPPLFYWLIALSYKAFGITEWAARLPLALMGWLGVVLAWQWARELWGARAGRAAAGMLAVSAGWYLFSHQLLIDEMLCVLLLAALYFLWKGVTQRECAAPWVCFYVTLALAILSKGLVGLAVPAAVLFFFVILKKDGAILRASRPLMGLLIIAVIVVPWLILMETRNPGFLHYVLVNEHWNRIFDKRWPPDYHASQTSWPIFLLLTLVWLAPWSFFLPQVFAFSAKHASRWSGVDRSAADAVSILGLGALLPTLLFLPVPSRLIYYSLPTLPPFAVLAAGWWVVMSGTDYRRGRKLAALLLLLFGIAVAVVPFFLKDFLIKQPDLAAAPQTLDYIPGFAVAIGAGMCCCGIMLLAGKTGAALLALCVPIGIGEAYNTQGFAAFDRVRSSRRMVEDLLKNKKVPPDCIWISEGSLELGAAAGTAFYLGTDNDERARFVYVVNSDNPNRRPPNFPGGKPEYLIDEAELNRTWSSPKPVLYVTDFLRHAKKTDDPIALPPDPRHRIEVEDAGHRQVWANEAAWVKMGRP
ncbi:MAG TPA: glycosyltransferase family 39 protein [Planctomycetota bacterium]|nr:glycosyltransferase family 39 protein [Planctomycetota bacterium]